MDAIFLVQIKSRQMAESFGVHAKLPDGIIPIDGRIPVDGAEFWVTVKLPDGSAKTCAS
jgi:hypothetical protein